jgi:hypothetical protein
MCQDPNKPCAGAGSSHSKRKRAEVEEPLAEWERVFRDANVEEPQIRRAFRAQGGEGAVGLISLLWDSIFHALYIISRTLQPSTLIYISARPENINPKPQAMVRLREPSLEPETLAA